MIALGVFFVLGISYALFSEVLVGEKQYSIESRGLKIYLNEEDKENSIVLGNAVPVTDDEGKRNASYNFSLVNEERQDLEYTIYLKEEEYDNKTPSSAIRYYYTRDVSNVREMRNITDNQTEDGRYYLETGIIPGGNTYNYTFRMWISYLAGNEILNTRYSIHLEIEAKQTIDFYKDEVLHGTDPVLSDNLVPVVIEDDGTVKKASLFQKWYDYQNQEWANAVVLEDKTKEYDGGEIIPESNIESYFVWIPRYKYKIFNEGNYTDVTELSDTAVQTIEIEFENKDTPVSGGTKKDEWLSHPAFRSFDSNGFWVGKFESGYRDATTTEEAQVNSNDASKLIIKPGVYSWRSITVGNAFKVSYDYLREDESHMMKNTEWGAVAYLQHSVYGSRQSVRINNNTAYKTGYASIVEPTAFEGSSEGNLIGTDDSVTQPYNTMVGYSASTTGNISGVYDMSGGAHEWVMGYNQNANVIGGEGGITGTYGDFFTDSRWDKYYDKYSNPTDSLTDYSIRILGDATGEMGPFGSATMGTASSWYRDFVYMIYAERPWYLRGGSTVQGHNAGIFASTRNTGRESLGISFRVVLTP